MNYAFGYLFLAMSKNPLIVIEIAATLDSLAVFPFLKIKCYSFE